MGSGYARHMTAVKILAWLIVASIAIPAVLLLVMLIVYALAFML